MTNKSLEKEVNFVGLLIPFAGAEELTKLTDGWVEKTSPLSSDRVKAVAKTFGAVSVYIAYNTSVMMAIGKLADYFN